MSDQSLREGTVFHDKYHVIRCIAQGGMGAVYEVLHLETQRKRALKVMLPSVVGSEELRNRFRAEARVASGIESEHVVETFDAGVDRATGMPFLVMELLRGQELASALAHVGRFPPERALPMLGQISRTLDKTHAARVVHRDLKPENIYLTATEDGSMRIKILDFGIAKIVAEGSGADKTKTLGTPLYMAPEQFDGSVPISPQTDLFALAHIAFTVLTGKAYWAEEQETSPSLYGFLMAMQTERAEPATHRASRRGAQLPPAFDGWFARATAKRASDRFRSAGEQQGALEQLFGVSSTAATSAAQYMSGPTVHGTPMQAPTYGGGPPITTFGSGPSQNFAPGPPVQATQLGGPMNVGSGPIVVPLHAAGTQKSKGGAAWIFALLAVVFVGAGAAGFLLTRKHDAPKKKESATSEPVTASSGPVPSSAPVNDAKPTEITFTKKDPAVGSRSKTENTTDTSISITRPANSDFSSVEKGSWTTTILAADGKTVLKVKVQYGEHTKTDTNDGKVSTVRSPISGKTYIAEAKDGDIHVTDDNYKPVPKDEEEAVKKNVAGLGKPNADLTALPDVPLKPGDRADTLSEMLKAQLGDEKDGQMSDVVVTLREIEVVGGVKRGIFDTSFKYVHHEDNLTITMTLKGTLIIRADNGKTVKVEIAGPMVLDGKAGGTGKMSMTQTED